MADKQKTALKRLAKKLSALRATLTKDERVLLDRIVLGGQDVSGHKMTTGAANTGAATAANKATEVALHSMTAGAANIGAAKAAKKATEVAMHKMTTGAANTGAATAANKATTEVALHSMTAGAANTGAANAAAGAASAAANAASMLQFDATTGGYRVTDAAI